MLSPLFSSKMTLPVACLAILNPGIMQAAYPVNSFQAEEYYSEEKDRTPSYKSQQPNLHPQETPANLTSHGHTPHQTHERDPQAIYSPSYTQRHAFIHGDSSHDPRYDGQPISQQPGHTPNASSPQTKFYQERPVPQLPCDYPGYSQSSYSKNEELSDQAKGEPAILQIPPPPKSLRSPRHNPPCENQAFSLSQGCQFSQFGYLRGAYTFGEGIGIRESFSTLTATFAPLVPYNNYYPFLDLRAHYIKNSRWAANVGGGLRWRDSMTGFIFGANLYYDYRKTAQMDANQCGFGLEFLTPCFEMRLNAYFPLKDGNHCDGHAKHEYKGPYCAGWEHVEVTQKGADLEVGHTFWKCPYFSLFGAIGGYYYTDVCGHRHHSHHHKKRWGEKARACLNLGSLLSIQARFYHDQSQHSFWQGVAMLSVPLDFCFRAAIQENYTRVFTQPVERNEMIVKRRFY
ncbi:inverse autotransporter beta domain-containing protein [Parachlamydia sp. AcF125]|uniref:inverse autotransporter beta domain-containing protein n=1 Tax=Parachlamydia sp. AcF125 TaxID=2795736 RepID=UPI001BC986C8|nr:inverse autotransporter beta domain-containing protein [Parachlamydia sp. AcF125]MBS4168941.1 hypothetical protein [Parachlamydia sp. AcF125]